MNNLANKNKTKTNNRREPEQESVITNAITFFQATSNNFVLMAKAHFRGSSFFLGNIVIPILISTGVSAFLPMVNGIIWIFFLSMTFSGMATYGTVFFTIRKSSIVKNINLTATESGTLYLATFMLIGLSLFITFNIIIGWTMMLDVIGFAMYEVHFINQGDPEGMWWIEWGVLMHNPALWYYWIEQIFLCFSMSFFFEKVVSTQKNFFILTFAYILAGIFFSGIFSSTLYVNAAGQIDIITEETTLEELDGIAALKPYLWGNGGWIVGQLFPHFGANQILVACTQGSAFQYDYIIEINENGDEVITWLDTINNYNKWYNLNIFTSMDSWKGDYYLAAPWLWSALLIWISAMIERFDKNRN